MNAVRTAHGAGPLLGREALAALDIGLRACEPGSATAHDDVSGWRENALSPAGVDRTDLCHGQSSLGTPRLSIIVPESRQVVVDVMIHEDDGLEDIMPSRHESTVRSSASAAIAFARREIEAWLRDGDDDEAFRTARLAIRGCAPHVFEATRMSGEGMPAEKLWFRHATSWSPCRIGMRQGGSQLPWLSETMERMAGAALPPPVTSIVFDGTGRDLRITIGPVVELVVQGSIDVISAMRCLNEAHQTMKDRP